MRKLIVAPGATLLITLLTQVAFAGEVNPNKWRVFRDDKAGFSMSYPDGWQILTPRGATVKMSTSPASGSGNCNVSLKEQPLSSTYTQDENNQMLIASTQDASDWASAMAMPEAAVKLVDLRKAKLGVVQAVTSKTEVLVETLQANYTRVQYASLMYLPGLVYVVNCGTSELDPKRARSRFRELDPTFKTVMATFRLETRRQ